MKKATLQPAKNYSGYIRPSDSDFTHGTMRRSISFPQLGGFKVSGLQSASSAMPAIVTGWPAVQRDLCFQSFN
jgi:hypothetical protein